jgi:cytochrome c556
MRLRIGLAAATLLFGASLLAGTRGLAQVKQGKTRPLTTKQMMSGLVGPAYKTLGQDLQGDGPTDDQVWGTAATRAALLNESGHMMMDDGRCPDAKWADACKALRESSQALLQEVQAKDAAGAREAMTAVSASCKSCHVAHKK